MNYKSAIVLFSVFFVGLSCGRESQTSTFAEATSNTDTLTLEHGIPYGEYSLEEGEVANGETFSGLLGKAGVPQSIANELIENAKKVFNVRDLRAGAHYHLYNVDDSCGGYPAWLVYDKSQREAVVFSLRDSLYAYIDEKDVATELKYAEVTIENSLWYDTQKAGCPALLAARLSDIYAWTIDFFGLQKGDSYQVLYESV